MFIFNMSVNKLGIGNQTILLWFNIIKYSLVFSKSLLIDDDDDDDDDVDNWFTEVCNEIKDRSVWFNAFNFFACFIPFKCWEIGQIPFISTLQITHLYTSCNW